MTNINIVPQQDTGFNTYMVGAFTTAMLGLAVFVMVAAQFSLA